MTQRVMNRNVPSSVPGIGGSVSGFVGRVEELELVDAVLRDPSHPFRVLYLHGPTGIGKTELLRAMAAEARRLEVPVAHVDGRTCDAWGWEVPNHVLRVSTGAGRVLLVDDYQPAGDGTARRRVLPALTDDVLVVLASSRPPPVSWLEEPD